MPNLTPFEYQQKLAREAARKPPVEPVETADRRAEKELHRDILDECQRRGWFVIHSRMDRKTTTCPGCPDFVIFAENGRAFTIECKTRRHKLTTPQHGTAAWLRKLGHEWYEVRSYRAFLHLAPLQGRGFFFRQQLPEKP